jgi:hypothetical protein
MRHKIVGTPWMENSYALGSWAENSHSRILAKAALLGFSARDMSQCAVFETDQRAISPFTKKTTISASANLVPFRVV